MFYSSNSNESQDKYAKSLSTSFHGVLRVINLALGTYAHFYAEGGPKAFWSPPTMTAPHSIYICCCLTISPSVGCQNINRWSHWFIYWWGNWQSVGKPIIPVLHSDAAGHRKDCWSSTLQWLSAAFYINNIESNISLLLNFWFRITCL